MPDKPVDVIAEVYQKIRVPSDNIYESKLVEIEIYKVSLLPSCVSHTLTKVEKESAEPTLVHSNKVKVKHGLIVIADDEDPKGLKVATRTQIAEFRIALHQYPTVDKPPRVCESGDADADWPAISRSRESVSDWEKADPHANQWQRGGHFVLKCTVNFLSTHRDRSETGKKRVAVQLMLVKPGRSFESYSGPVGM